MLLPLLHLEVLVIVVTGIIVVMRFTTLVEARLDSWCVEKTC
jgi:hypothetical protein